MKTKWQLIVDYINQAEINETVLRKQMIEIINSYTLEHPKTAKYATVDFYREVLTRIGVLEYISRGHYKKLRDIPKDLSSSKAREYAFMEPKWKRWFIPFDEFMKEERKRND